MMSVSWCVLATVASPLSGSSFVGVGREGVPGRARVDVTIKVCVCVCVYKFREGILATLSYSVVYSPYAQPIRLRTKPKLCVCVCVCLRVGVCMCIHNPIYTYK